MMSSHLEEKRIALLGLAPPKNPANEKPKNEKTTSRKRSNSNQTSSNAGSTSTTTNSSSSSSSRKRSGMTTSNSTNSLTSASPPTINNTPTTSNQQPQTYTSIIQNNGERPLTVVIKAPSPSPSIVASATVVESSATSQILAPPTITSVIPAVSPSLSLSKILPTNIDSESVDSASDDSYFIEDDDDESWSEASDEEEEDENYDDTEEIVIVDDDFYKKNLENIPTQEQAQIIQKNINSDKVQFLHTVTVIPVTTSVPRLKRQLSSGMNRKRITKKTIGNPTIQMEQFFKRLRVEQLIKYRRYHNIKTVTPVSSREELEEATINHFKDENDFVPEKTILSQLLQRLDTAIPRRK